MKTRGPIRWNSASPDRTSVSQDSLVFHRTGPFRKPTIPIKRNTLYVTSRMRSWNQSYKKYKGRVVLRGDIVKDDFGAHAVFTEQGSSASQMTAAKNNGCYCKITRLWRTSSWCSIGLFQVQVEDAPRLLKIPKTACPDVWIRLPRHRWPKSWESIEDPVAPLERNLYGHPQAVLLWERQFEEALSELGWEKIPNWECMFVHRRQGLFLSVCVDDIRMAGKQQNVASMWKKLMTNVDIESRISAAGATEKVLEWQKPRAQTVAWSYDMEGHAQKCVERYCDWQIRKWSNCTKFQALAWMIINSSRKTSNQLEKCQKSAHKMSWNACVWHELEDQTVCGRSASLRDQSQNGLGHVTDAWQGWFRTFIKQTVSDNVVMSDFAGDLEDSKSTSGARAVTKWTRACAKCLARLISYIHPTCDYKRYCHLGNTAKQCTLGLFQDSDFAGDLWGFKFYNRWNIMNFGSHAFVPVSWMCKKQIAVSDSSTESETIALDAGLRMDGLRALDLWVIVIEVLRSTNNNVQPKHTSIQETDALHSKTKRRQKVDRLSDVDNAPTNILLTMNLSCTFLSTTKQWSKWYLKGRCPTMRHVSRTLRVALDWLFDRIYLEPKIRIKYIDT